MESEKKQSHFLFKCQSWKKLRGERKPTGRRWGDTTYMLGGWSGSGKDGSLDTWNPNYKVVTATINFITATGRLKERRSTAEEGSEESKKKNSKLNRRLVTITHTLLSSGTSLNICNRDQRLSRRLRCYMISHSREIHSRNITTSDNIWMGYLKKK